MELIRQAIKNAGLKEVDYNLEFIPELAKSNSAIDHIIIHHDVWTGGTMKDIHIDHQKNKGYRGTGYNVRVRKDGSVELGRPFGMVGGHCSQDKMNYHSLGLVFEGNFDKEQMGRVQFEAGAKLIAETVRLSNYIKLDNIKPHNIYAKKSCPGTNFPLKEMLSYSTAYSVEKYNPHLQVSDWAKTAHEWVVENGVSDGTRPKDPVTREEVWTMLHNFLSKL